jgi:hypothetical protein
MEDDEKRSSGVHIEDASSMDADDRRLQELGYVPSFKREFTNLATVSDSALLSKEDGVTQLCALWRSDQLCVLNHGSLLSRRRVSVCLTWTAQGLCSSIATTFNTPLLLGGPASVRNGSPRSRPNFVLILRHRSRGVGFWVQSCASPSPRA